MHAPVIMQIKKLPFPEEYWFKLDGRIIEFPEGLKTDRFTHTLHRFPGKFIPQVAQELLNLVAKKAAGYVLDPFCGSGTLLLESACQGIPSIGFDIDPHAVFITKTKTTPLSEHQIKHLEMLWDEPIDSGAVSSDLPDIENLDHWFSQTCLEQLSILKGKIQTIEDEAERNFSYAVFSSIIRRVSNADDQTQKTYVSGTLKKTPALPYEIFPTFMTRSLKNIRDYSLNCEEKPLVRLGDARKIKLDVPILGVATSPPYIDSIDYIYNQMLEYYWLFNIIGMKSPRDVKDLRKTPMGFRKVNIDDSISRLYQITPKAGNLLSPLVEKVNEISKSEAQNIIGYFEDFIGHLNSISPHLKSESRYAIVVGESFIRGVTIPTAEILNEIFQSLGYNLIGRCAYVIKKHYMKFPRRSNSRTIKTDHVLCFEKL